MDDESLDKAFAALADPVRRAIVARLSRGPATLGELAEPFAITPQAVSKIKAGGAPSARRSAPSHRRFRAARSRASPPFRGRLGPFVGLRREAPGCADPGGGGSADQPFAYSSSTFSAMLGGTGSYAAGSIE